MTFNLGSSANKLLEFKYINVFSYNDIYNMGKVIADSLIKNFNLKTKANQDGESFESIGKNVIVGAGAVVNNNLPDSCTAVGIPARIISYGRKRI